MHGRRLTLLASLALGLSLLAAPGAVAEPLETSSRPVPLEPAENAEVEAGTIPTFRFARGVGGSNYGGRYDGTYDSYTIVVSRDPTVLASGTIQQEVESGYPLAEGPQGPWSWRPLNRSYSSSWWLQRPGIYYWQVYRNDCYQDVDCRVEGPIRRLTVVPKPAAEPLPAPVPAPLPPAPVLPPIAPAPAPPSPTPKPRPEPTPKPPRPAPPTVDPVFDGLGAAAIPYRFGHRRNGKRFRVYLGGIPDEVPSLRFRVLAEDSGERWGARMRGTTRRRPVHDGQSTVGFGFQARGLLGTTVTYQRVRVRRVCGARGCRNRVVSRRLTGERDVVLTRRVRWEPGPRYPATREFDLQTVLIHEFGHFVGNHRHVRGACAAHPLTVAGMSGDWWRGPGDVSRARCHARPRSVGPAPLRMRFAHVVRRVVVRDDAR